MPKQDIDTLVIQVESSASKANTNLKNLSSNLEKLNQTISNINTGNLKTTINDLNNLKNIAKDFNSSSIKNVKTAINQLNNVKFDNIKNISSNLSTLSNSLKKFSYINIPNLQNLQSLFNGLRSLGGTNVSQATKNLPKISKDLTDFVKSLNGIGSVSFNVQSLGTLIQSISALGGAKISTAATQNLPKISKDLTRFVRQMNKIKNVTFDVSKFTALTESIRKLGLKSSTNAVPNIQALATAIKNMMLTLRDAPNVSNNIIRMTNAMANLASQGQRVASTARSVTNGIRGTGTAADSANGKVTSLASAIGKLYAEYWLLLKVFKGFGYALKQSMDFLETVNYFEVAFKQIGEDAAEQWKEMGYKSAEAYAKSFAERAKDFTLTLTGYEIDTEGNATLTDMKNLGLDPNQVMNYQAMYAQMANSLGLTQETALNVSKALVGLGADWASLRNISLDSAWEKFASALAGQSRAVRTLGIEITQATLQEYAYKYGIDQSIASMNQQAKAQLRILAILDQSKVAYGDMANTLSSAANQLRLFQQNVTNLARTIGNLFVGMFAKIAPVVNAIIILLQRLFTWLAKIFGIELTGVNSSMGGMSDTVAGLVDSTEDVAGSFEDVESGASGAADAVEDLAKATGSLPFDELHTFSQDTQAADTGGGGGGIGGGGGLDMGDTGFDLLDSEIAKATQKYLEALQNALDNSEQKAKELADTLQSLVPIIAGIGAGLLALKLAPGLISSLNKLKTLMQAINAWGAKSALKGLFLQAGSAITQMLPGLAKITPAMGAWAAAIGLVTAHYVNLYQNSERFRDGLSAIVSGAKAVAKEVGLIFGAIGDIIGEVGGGIWQGIKDIFASFNIDLSFLDPVIEQFKEFINALDLDISDLGMNIIGVGALIAGLTIPGAQFLAPIGAFILAAEQLSVVIRAIGYWTSDAVEQVDVFGEGISEVTKQKVAPFVESMKTMQQTLDSVYFDAEAIIDDEDVNSIATSLDSIVSMITTELDADKNEALAQLNPLKNLMSEESYQKALSGIYTYYEQMTKQVTDNEAAINQIIATAKAEQRNLTTEEYAEINRLREEMNKTGIQQLSESEIEYETIMRRLKDNSVAISAEQAEQIIADAKKTKDEAITNAETQYSEVVLNAKRMEEAGVISKDEYNAIVTAAQKTRDDAVAAAEEQYDGIYNTTAERFPKTTTLIDKETGEMRSKWEIAVIGLKNIWSTFWDNAKTTVSNGINSVITWLSNKKDQVVKIGTDIIKYIAEGLMSIDEKISEFCSELPQKFINGIANAWGELKSIGSYILEGIAQGLMQTDSKVGEFVAKILLGTQKEADIHSPSKLFEDEVGVYLGEGVAKGFIASTSTVVEAARSVLDEVIKVFEGVEYSPNIDYAALMEEAKATGNLEILANLELQRNAKIQGEGLDYSTTFDYQDFAEKTDATNTTLTSIDETFKLSYENELEGFEVTNDTFDQVKDIAKIGSQLIDVITEISAKRIEIFNNFSMTLSETLLDIISAINSIEINVYKVVQGSAYATGGFVEEGPFYANRGEIIGKFSNGRTAVANNEQIVEGIKRGVYEAVYEAMRNTSNNDGGTVIENILKLDNEVIYKGQQKVIKKRGYNFNKGAFTRA